MAISFANNSHCDLYYTLERLEIQVDFKKTSQKKLISSEIYVFSPVQQWSRARQASSWDYQDLGIFLSTTSIPEKLNNWNGSSLSLITILFEKSASDGEFWKDRRLKFQRRMKDDKNRSTSTELLNTFHFSYKDLGVKDKGTSCVCHSDMNRFCSSREWTWFLQITVQLVSWAERTLQVLVCKLNNRLFSSKWCLKKYVPGTNTSACFLSSQCPLGTDTVDRHVRTLT